MGPTTSLSAVFEASWLGEQSAVPSGNESETSIENVAMNSTVCWTTMMLHIFCGE